MQEFIVPQVAQPMKLTDAEKQGYFERIAEQLKTQNAVLITHYYTDPLLQEITELTGGKVSDSLEMARFGAEHPASTLIVLGVRFMGETAKILSPEKRILMPTLEATCSLDLSCPAQVFSDFCDQHPDRTVVVYANTSAAVKARADWVVTSSIAVDVVKHLDEQGDKILWAPDKYLGQYIKDQTDADMLLWQGSCVVHESFKAKALEQLRVAQPDAAVLVHPESPGGVIAQADVVGSTSQLIKAVSELPNQTFIVATDRGIFYKMLQAAPGKTLIEAPTAGEGATCRSCAHCPWMAMNNLENLEQTLKGQGAEILLDADLIQQARVPLERMLAFKK